MLWLLAACGGKECDEGFTERDGLCYAEQSEPDPLPTATEIYDPLGIDSILNGLEPCTAQSGDGDLDLLGGCAGDVCFGMTYEEIEGVLGPAELSPSFSDPSSLYADWPQGFAMFFDDLDLDGQPDPGSTGSILFIDPPYAGSTLEGQGIGVELSCFVGVAPPESLSILELGDSKIISIFFEGFLLDSDDGVYVNGIGLTN